MSATTIRDATSADFAAIVALNAAAVHFTSPMDTPRLAHLHAHAAYHRLVDDAGQVRAFLLAFREGAPYDSPNYRWFAQHYARFLYIDRIVVANEARSQGLGRILYDDILQFATLSGAARLTCEFDVEPPNPVSAKFHARFGFREVGRQWLSGGRKQVSLQLRELESSAA